jgi:hypothetical protein
MRVLDDLARAAFVRYRDPLLVLRPEHLVGREQAHGAGDAPRVWYHCGRRDGRVGGLEIAGLLPLPFQAAWDEGFGSQSSRHESLCALSDLQPGRLRTEPPRVVLRVEDVRTTPLSRSGRAGQI